MAKNVSLQEQLQPLIGQPIAILCSRYVYRGIVSQAEEDFLVLANACAVEETGPATGEKPNQEDRIGGSLTVLYAGIEIIFQPRWCHAPIGED